MTNLALQQNSVSQLAAQADAVGKLAQDTGAFAATFAAFESNDPDAFRWVLQRLDIVPQCELICEWIRVKWCVLRCVEVCGPPDPKAPTPELAQFANALIRLASNEGLLRRVVDAVSCGDGDRYKAAIAEGKLEAFCHLVCRYVCSAYYRRICEVVCTPHTVPVTDVALGIRADAEVLSKVVANKKLSAAIANAAVGLECETLQSAIGEAGFNGDCEIICRLICVWRCVHVSQTLCREPPRILSGTYAIEEARNFALAARQLASQPRALADLVAAVVNNNAEVYGAIVDRYGLAPYCWQVCGWVCSEVCYEFCVCVCVNQAEQVWFTHVGDFNISSGIDPTTGRTTPSGATAAGFGGPNYAFYGPLTLSGHCPATSPASPGNLMQYRFLYDNGSGPQAITGASVCDVLVGTRQINWPNKVGILAGSGIVLTAQDVWVSSTVTADPTPPASGANYVWPTKHVINPDTNGWVAVDPGVSGGFTTLLCFDTTQVVPGGTPAPGGLGYDPQPGVSAGIPVPAANQRAGTPLAIIFQATTVPPTTSLVYSNTLSKILVNNFEEVNELNFVEFAGTACCTPINDTLSVEFTVDHEEMDAGAWSLAITACATLMPPPPGNITPTSTATAATSLTAAIPAAASGATNTINVGPVTFVPASGVLPTTPFTAVLGSGATAEIMTVTAVAGSSWTVTRGQGGTTALPAPVGTALSTGVIVTARGGSGIIGEDTSNWGNCSYTVTLNTMPGLTTGLADRPNWPNTLTFCICGH
jgi:hypothetical protein